MKQKIYLVMAGLVLLSAQLKAQVPPQALNYQGVARDALGSTLPNQSIGLEFTVIKGSPSGTIVYRETQTVTTNEFGLFATAIGNGTPAGSYNFSAIDWGGNSEFLEVGMDPNGGTNYTEMGTHQLLSVPYALYAASSGSGGGSVTSVSANSPLSVTTPSTTPALSLIGSSGSILYGTGIASAFSSQGTSGQVLQSNGTGAPTWVTPSGVTVAQPNQQLVYGTGTGISSSSNLIYNGNQLSAVGNSNWGIINIQPAASGQESSIGFWNSVGGTDTSWVVGINDGGLSNGGFGIFSTQYGNVIEIADPTTGAITFNRAYTFPTSDGSNGQMLTTDGAGNVTWQTPNGGGSSNAWGLSGNAGTTYNSNQTTSAGNFIGTTDDEGLQFRVNGNIAGLIEDFSSSEGDAAFGYEALYNNYENGGSQSEAFGYQALYNNGGTQNDAFGYQALYGNTYATQDVGIGYQSLYNNDNDQQGLANNNTAVGALSLYNNIDNANNVAIGYQALYSDDLDDNNSANYNTAVGALALSNDVDGSSNTAVGFNANFSSSDQGNPINNSTAIGANALVNTSNTVQLGRFANVQFDQALMPAGNAGTVGQVLQSNGPNTAPTWVAAAGGGSSNAWSLTGNTGTIYGTNYLGTTDDEGLMLEVDGTIAGRIEDGNPTNGSNWNNAIGYISLAANSGTNNEAFGGGALNNNTGNFNVAIGDVAMGTNTGSYNVGIGASVMNSTQGNNNVGIGAYAMNNNTGSNNVGVGYLALSVNQGDNNTATGYEALQNNQSGFGNVAMGVAALVNNQVSSQNVAVGYSALSNNDNDGFNIGQNNSALGFQALQKNIDGYNNTAMGTMTLTNAVELYDNTAFGAYALMNVDIDNNGTAYANTAVGANALDRDIDGNVNTALGYEADFNTADLGNASSNNIIIGAHTTINNSNGAINNSVVLGAAAEVDSSNSIVFGNNSIAQTDFNGAFGIWNGTNYDQGSPGQILQSNGPHVSPTWATANAWGLNGNSGTTYGANFIGTTDDEGILFVIGDFEAGRIEDGNPANGSNWNDAIGYQALAANSGTNNNALGGFALNNNTGNLNSAVGNNALATNTGNDNVAIGASALPQNSGSENTAVGFVAMNGNPNNIVSGSNNTALGGDAMFRIVTGGNNTASGYNAGGFIINSSSNAAFGAYAFNGSDGDYNTAIGDSTLLTSGTGTYNTALGYNADVASGNLTDATAIGAKAVADSSNSVVLGNNSVTQTDFNGALGVWNGANYNEGSTGQILQSNGPDVAPTWVAPLGGGNAWGLSGNSGTTYGTNYVGTSDNTNLMFKIDKSEAGRIENATTANTAFGYNSLLNLSSGIENTGVGVYSLYADVDGSNNTALGYESGFNAEDNGNPSGEITLIGAQALLNNIPGAINNATVIGYSAEGDSSNSVVLGNHSVTQVDFNGALGVWNGSNYNEGTVGQVLQSNGPDLAPTWGIPPASLTNAQIGYGSGSNILTSDQYFIRIYQGIQVSDGADNIFIGGNGSGGNDYPENQGGGTGNISLGSGALGNISNGNNNISLGYNSLATNQNGSNLIAIGSGADVNADGYSNSIALGSTIITSSNQFVVNSSITNWNIGGVSYAIPTSQGAASTVLTNDGSGNLSWGVPVASETLFTPSDGGTIGAIVGTNIVNPSGSLSTLTVTLPSSPTNGQCVELKFTNSIGTISYSGGSVAASASTNVGQGSDLRLFYDAGTSTWY